MSAFCGLMASFELFGTDTIGVRRTLSSLAWPTERHERTIGDEFIFRQTRVQRVYYPGRFIDSRGSKSLYVKSQFFRVHRTNDFPLLFYPESFHVLE